MVKFSASTFTILLPKNPSNFVMIITQLIASFQVCNIEKNVRYEFLKQMFLETKTPMK